MKKFSPPGIPIPIPRRTQYISRPLLLNKRKFHIRAYVLAMGAIKVYFYDEILALCSGSKVSEKIQEL